MAIRTSVVGSGLDYWNTATWVGGVLPAIGDIAIIPSGSHVLVATGSESIIELVRFVVNDGGSFTLTIDETYCDFLVESGGVLQFGGAGTTYDRVLVETGAVLHLVDEISLGYSFTAVIESGGDLNYSTSGPGNSSAFLLMAYAGANLTGSPSHLNQLGTIKSRDLPAAVDVRSGASYAGGQLEGTLGGGTVTISVE